MLPFFSLRQIMNFWAINAYACVYSYVWERWKRKTEKQKVGGRFHFLKKLTPYTNDACKKMDHHLMQYTNLTQNGSYTYINTRTKMIKLLEQNMRKSLRPWAGQISIPESTINWTSSKLKSMHFKRYHLKNEKTGKGPEENICKAYIWWRACIQNI